MLEGGVTALLRLERVSKVFRTGALGRGELTAVRDVSFDVEPGEIVSLIGESGSGKTTIGRMILRLTRATSGAISFNGADISSFEGRALNAYRGEVQGVFQDPFSSYNPIFTVDHTFGMLRRGYCADLTSADWAAKLEASITAVSLEPEHVLGKYPHQLSGGQLQRLLIARALLLDIRILVADEIISMLDASTRVDVLNLLGDLKARGLGVVFVTHDLSLGYYISDKAVILRSGVVVESGSAERVFGNPLHAYTRMLLGSVAQLEERWVDDPAPADDREGEARLPPDPPDAVLVEAEPNHFVLQGPV